MKTPTTDLQMLLTLLFIAGASGFTTPVLAYSGGPDAGYTGAPGELTCANCHTPPVAVAGSVSLSGVPPAYKPGVIYGLTVSVTGGGVRSGFEITAINNSGTQAGNFVNTTASTQFAPLLGTNPVANTRQYVSHNITSSTSNSWRFNWTAPNPAIGPVRFYVAGLRGDGMLTTTGDTVYTNTATCLDQLRLALARSGTNITLTWTGGTLQYVDKLVPGGTVWTNVPGNPTSPYTTNTLQARRFYRTAYP